MPVDDVKTLLGWLGNRWTKAVILWACTGIFTIASATFAGGIAYQKLVEIQDSNRELIDSVKSIKNDFENYKAENNRRIERIENRLDAGIKWEK